MRPLLENWLQVHRERFHLHYCVGSRWANVHMGAKKKDEYIPPPSPEGLNNIPHASLVRQNKNLYLFTITQRKLHKRLYYCSIHIMETWYCRVGLMKKKLNNMLIRQDHTLAFLCADFLACTISCVDQE